MKTRKANGKNNVLLKCLVIAYVLVACSAVDLPGNLNNKNIFVIRYSRQNRYSF